MSYESGQWLYAGGLAGIYAYAALVNPVRGLAIAAGATSIASNPQSIAAAGDRWTTAGQDVAAAQGELHELIASVPPEKWTAQDREMFTQAVQEFNQTLRQGGQVYDSVAGNLKGLAGLSYAGGVVVAAAGAVLGALAATRFIPGVNLVTAPAGEAIAIPVERTVLGLVRKYGMAATVAGTLLSIAVGFNQSKAAELEAGAQPLDLQKPQFTSLDLPLTNLNPPQPTP
ncbi:hypothetical protein [Sphaerisporangium aureirubrum]|uniref:Uncharacterized protein n=1 Tax=Sphaerisporangium aureirubrum TaxID=1544736 RepID=A0ABW1NVN0_9ACTN